MEKDKKILLKFKVNQKVFVNFEEKYEGINDNDVFIVVKGKVEESKEEKVVYTVKHEKTGQLFEVFPNDMSLVTWASLIRRS